MSDNLPRADEPGPNEPLRPGADRSSVLERLRKIAPLSKQDPERYHCEADDLLLECIDGELAAEIRNEYRAIVKWYS